MIHRMIFIFLSCWPLLADAAPPSIHIIPLPAQMTVESGSFRFTGNTSLEMETHDSAFNAIAQAFSDELFAVSGLRLNKGRTDKNNIIISMRDDLPHEGYAIDVTPASVHIAAKDGAGLFYAFVTFRQLLPSVFFSGKRQAGVSWTLPAVHILDWPRFGYRGMHLDVSRHFFPVAFLKVYLDILASYKINTFHWHLTDSHGWRLEIKRYPKLTSIGAWRATRHVPMTISPPTAENEPADYGGYYTQEQVRDLLRYAAKRYITIIPEIEMPGHCDEAVVAYPEFTCLNNPVPLLRPTGYEGDLTHNFCPGNDSTFVFLEGILDEVMALFPSEYIHIGGDEVKPVSWLSCPRCRQRMKDHHYTTANELQGYFTHRIDQYITSKHKRLIGWDEIMEAGISQNAAVMSWRGDEGGVAAAKAGHPAVMAPNGSVYFDFYQSAPELEPNITYAALPLEKVYAFEPVPTGLDTAQQHWILGGEACLWTENISTPERVEYMLLPRLLALSECLWSPASAKNYRSFFDRCEEHLKILDKENIQYARSVYNVFIEPRFDSVSKTVEITLKDQCAGKYTIHYNLKGQKPTAADPEYTQPVTIRQSSAFSAALFDGGNQLGKISKDHFSIHQALDAGVSSVPALKDAAALSKLTDGIHGTFEPDNDRWVKFKDSVFSMMIRLRAPKMVHTIRFHCLEDMIGNILAPASIKMATSSDGVTYHPVYEHSENRLPLQKLRHIIPYCSEAINRSASYIRIDIQITRKKYTIEPSPNSVLIDEIMVE